MPMIQVRHNIEVAHRLSELRGKCEAIHGHSMLVSLQIFGEIDSRGILEGLDFSTVKKEFRSYLDTEYDHRLLLNASDPWAQPIETVDAYQAGTGSVLLPGLATFMGDPTTENLARWISEWALEKFGLPNQTLVEETHVNAAGYESLGAFND